MKGRKIPRESIRRFKSLMLLAAPRFHPHMLDIVGGRFENGRNIIENQFLLEDHESN